MKIEKCMGLIPLSLQSGYTLTHYDEEKLLPNGENYGSIILKVNVYLRSLSDEEKVLYCIAKLPPSTKFLWKVFNIPITFKKELIFYKNILPALNAFGVDTGIKRLLPFVVDFIGSRLSLNPKSEEVDHEAVLVLRNVKEDGYIMCDRFQGVDEDTAFLALQCLAILHASVIAYKLIKPIEFQDCIGLWTNTRTYLTLDVESTTKYIDHIKEVLGPTLTYAASMDKIISKITNLSNASETITYREPFASFVHNDFWVNNIMVKFDYCKPISCKLIDFQLWDYGNPLDDVLFFLYTSIKLDLLTKLDEYLDSYFQHFIKTLKRLRCDVDLFTKELFMDEVVAAANSQFIHILLFSRLMFIKTSAAKDSNEINSSVDLGCDVDFFTKELFMNEVAAAANSQFIHILLFSRLAFIKTSAAKDPNEIKACVDFDGCENDLHENYYDKLHFIIQDYSNRGWL